MEQRAAPVLELDFAALEFGQTFEEVRQRVAGQPLPERSLEDGAEGDNWMAGQEYSYSSRMREVVAKLLGPVALQEVATIEDLPLEVRAALVSLRRRQETAVIEMIQTYPDLRAHFQIEYEERHLVRDGEIVALDGETRISSMLERGEQKAKEAAEINPLMVSVARRTGADRRFGDRAKNLGVGEWLVGPSAYEDSADELFMRSIGWHKGLSFWQAACRLSEDETLMFSYSVDPVPSDVIRKVWEKMSDTPLPEGLLADTWQDYSKVFAGSEAECRELIRTLRAMCYKETGDTRKRFTLEDVFRLNETASKEIFNKLYMRIVLGVKDEVIQTFTQGLLDDPQALNEEMYWKLLDSYNRTEMTQEDADTLESMVRYAEAQHYCRALRAAIASGSLATKAVVRSFKPIDAASLNAMAIDLSMKVLRGARDNDIFGGCVRVIVAGKRRGSKKSGSGADLDEFELMDAAEGDEEDQEEGEDLGERKWAVCRTDNCPSRGSNPKKPKKTNCGGCDICLDWCQPVYRVGGEPRWSKKRFALVA